MGKRKRDVKGKGLGIRKKDMKKSYVGELNIHDLGRVLFQGCWKLGEVCGGL